MKKIFYILLGLSSLFAGTTYAVAQPSFAPSLLPLTTATYFLGTTTPVTNSWKGIVVDQVCLTADSCRTMWPTGGAGSVGNWFSGFPNYNATSTTLGFQNGFFSTASSTINNNFFLPNLTGGSAYIGSNGLVQSTPTTTASCSGNASCTPFVVFGSSPVTISASGGGSSFGFPFDTSANYNSTSSKPIGFLNGLFSTASSTFNNSVFFSNLTQGFAGISPTGLLYTFATSTIKGSQITNDSSWIASVFADSPLSGNGTSGSHLTCTNASNGVTGCVSSADYGKFNSATTTAGTGLTYLSNSFNVNQPFTNFANYNATNTTIGFTNGIFSTASSTFNNNLFLSNLGQGFAYIAPNGLVRSVASSSINLSGFNNDSAFLSTVMVNSPLGGNGTAGSPLTCSTCSGSSFPFTAFPNYNATGTTIGFTNGLFSTASSTFNNDLFLSNLSQGYSYIGTNGIVKTVSTSTLASQVFSATTFSPNSIITTNASGNLIATGTQLTVGNIIGTTTANSYFLGNLGVSTSTPQWPLTVFSNTGPQIALSFGGGIPHWFIRNGSSDLFIGTTTIDGLSTTTTSALSIAGSGFGTTTLAGLNIVGQATTTSNVGINLTTGCYAINKVCLSTSGSSGITSLTLGTGLVQNGTTITTTGTINGAVGTSTTPVIGNLAMWSSTGSGGTTATLHSISTTTASCIGFLTCITFNILGSSPVTFSATHDEFTPHPFLGASATTSTMAIGTTTISSIAQLTVASSTKSGLAIGDNTPGDPLWVARNTAGNLSFSTTTVDGTSTTTTSALTLQSTGVPAMTIGSTTASGVTYMNTLKNGTLVLGGNGTNGNGTSTVQAGKIQFDGLNSAGGRICMFVNSSNAFTVITGGCTP